MNFFRRRNKTHYGHPFHEHFAPHHNKYLPFWNDRADYRTDAPSLFDYLARLNGNIFEEIDKVINHLLNISIVNKDSKSVKLSIKKPSHDEAITDKENNYVIQADVNISKDNDLLTLDNESTYLPNSISVKSDGLFSPDLKNAFIKYYNKLLDRMKINEKDISDLKKLFNNNLQPPYTEIPFTMTDVVVDDGLGDQIPNRGFRLNYAKLETSNYEYHWLVPSFAGYKFSVTNQGNTLLAYITPEVYKKYNIHPNILSGLEVFTRGYSGESDELKNTSFRLIVNSNNKNIELYHVKTFLENSPKTQKFYLNENPWMSIYNR